MIRRLVDRFLVWLHGDAFEVVEVARTDADGQVTVWRKDGEVS